MSRPQSRQPSTAVAASRRSVVSATPRPSSRLDAARPPSRQLDTSRPSPPNSARPSSRQTVVRPSPRLTAAKTHSVAVSAGRLIVGSDTPGQLPAEAPVGSTKWDGSKPDALHMDLEEPASQTQTGKMSLKKKGAARAQVSSEQQEVESLQRRLFEAADRSKSGSVQFNEFVSQHQLFITQLGDQSAHCAQWARMTPKELEREFRRRDTDHSLNLNFEEYAQYTESIHMMLGHRSFVQLCTKLLEESQAEEPQREGGFDVVASDLLVEKLRKAPAMSAHLSATVSQLLGRRADANYVGAEGDTPLLVAAEKGDLELVSQLLRAQAEPERLGRGADCALLRALRAQNTEVARLLVSPPAVAQAAAGTAEAAEPLTAQAALAAQAASAASAELLRIMPEASGEAVRELLARRADPNHRDERGWTPLIAAVFWGRKDCVEAILRHHQLNPNVVRLQMDGVNKNGLSPLHIAARKGREELVPLLLAGRCTMDLPDIDGWTPLHHAAFNGMDSIVQLLMKRHADMLVQGSSGFTPWMVSVLPTRAGKLSEATLRLLDPNENINFSRQILPVLGSASLSPYEKLQELYSLPGVAHVAANLRLYEHFFHVRAGPNKVRLTKLWEGLLRDLLLRLRSGETDVVPQGTRLTEEQREEQARRWHDQKVFLRHCLRETRGPPPSHDWQHDSREAYRAELKEAAAAEIAGFRQELAEAYARLREQRSGEALAAVPACEVLRPEYMSQLSAHSILSWVDTQNAAAAFRALCGLKAFGTASQVGDALERFSHLCSSPDFETGEGFWRNIYKLWLHHHALSAQDGFQQVVSSIVGAFNERHGPEGLAASFRAGPVKTYERLKAKEAGLGPAKHATHGGCLVASRILDVVRSSITVNGPEAAVTLLDEYFRPLQVKKDRAALVRVVNSFSEKVETRYGYRDLALNLYYEGGVVGEVQIVLQDFLSIKKRMHLLVQYSSGEFDHKPASPQELRRRRSTQSLECDE